MAIVTLTSTGASPKGISNFPTRGFYPFKVTKCYIGETPKAKKPAVFVEYTFLASFPAGDDGKLNKSDRFVGYEDSHMIMLQDGKNEGGDAAREGEQLGILLALGVISEAPAKGTQLQYDTDHLVGREGVLAFDPPTPEARAAAKAKGDKVYAQRIYFTNEAGREYIGGKKTAVWKTWDVSAAVPGMTSGGVGTSAAAMLPPKVATPTGAAPTLPAAPVVAASQPANMAAPTAAAPTAAASVGAFVQPTQPPVTNGAPAANQQW